MGPMGETHGKGGVPEMEAVASLTIAALQQRLMRRDDTVKCSLQLWCTNREWGAIVDVDGIEGSGYGPDAESTILMALANCPEVL